MADLRRHFVGALRRVLGHHFDTARRWYYWRSRWQAPQSFSQTGEDIILRGYLRENHGTYIDVGAADPIRGNNTWFLYQRGWTGVCIDPIPGNARELERVRGKDRIVEALCSSTVEPLRFFQFSDPEYSTVSPELAAIAQTYPGVTLVAERVIETVTLRSLNVRTTPREPSLLAIDVEGHEMAVLESNDWETFLPRVICVEELSSPLHGSSAVRTFLENKGYQLVAFTGLSSIYLHATASS